MLAIYFQESLILDILGSQVAKWSLHLRSLKKAVCLFGLPKKKLQIKIYVYSSVWIMMHFEIFWLYILGCISGGLIQWIVFYTKNLKTYYINSNHSLAAILKKKATLIYLYQISKLEYIITWSPRE